MVVFLVSSEVSMEEPGDLKREKEPAVSKQPGRYIHHVFIYLETEAAESPADVQARVFEQDLAHNVVRIEDRDLDYENAMYDANRREEGSAGRAVPCHAETWEAERKARRLVEADGLVRHSCGPARATGRTTGSARVR